MRLPITCLIGPLLLLAGLALPATLHAQVAAARFETWQGRLPQETSGMGRLRADSVVRAATRNHTGTGLLIGGLVGAAATTLFLVAFCVDPDTACGADEVGRAVVVIALPFAAVGALIGSLVRTEERTDADVVVQ
jgi:hypothetical protein